MSGRVTGFPEIVPGRWTLNCALLYILIYAFESPIRYILNFGGADAAILVRDALIDLPLVILFIRQFTFGRVQMLFWVFLLVLSVHGAVYVLNMHEIGPAVLGTKILVNVMFGMFLGSRLLAPGPTVERLLLALWIATVLGIVLEKFVVTFPWVGMHADIGGVDTVLSRDWQIDDPMSKRVGGFTRMSIAAAGIVSILGLLVMSRTRRWAVRVGIALVTCGTVFLTTQKGALLGLLLASAPFSLPRAWRLGAFQAVALLGLLATIAVPLLTNDMPAPAVGGGGPFSEASLIIRIVETWPSSFDWIASNEVFPFGIGTGGIGVSQLMVQSVASGWPDNFFLLMFAFFGWFAIPYMAVILWGVLRAGKVPQDVAQPALALVGFLMVYGIVVSIVEDSMGAIFLGAAAGALLERSPAGATRRRATVLRPSLRFSYGAAANASALSRRSAHDLRSAS